MAISEGVITHPVRQSVASLAQLVRRTVPYMSKRRMTKAAARKFVEELVQRARGERRLAVDETDATKRERAVGRAEGYTDAALLLTASFHLDSADVLDGGRLKPCVGCGYAFCRCASCGKSSCGKG